MMMTTHEHNPNTDLETMTRSHVDHVTKQLSLGVAPSELANHLHAQGLGCILITYIFKKATGARLMDLKQFGQWWSDHGVTDVDSFDAYAKTIM